MKYTISVTPVYIYKDNVKLTIRPDILEFPYFLEIILPAQVLLIAIPDEGSNIKSIYVHLRERREEDEA